LRMPRDDTLARARQRAFIEFGSAILSDIWGLEIAPNRDVLDARVEALAQKFARIEDELGRGPWFAGEAFGLVDAVFAPVLRYFDSFDAIFDHGILAHKPKIAAWRGPRGARAARWGAGLAARSGGRGAVSADYRARLDRFTRGKNGALGALMTSRAGGAGLLSLSSSLSWVLPPICLSLENPACTSSSPAGFCA